jgi:flagellar hook-associated protein 3 FlgL
MALYPVPTTRSSDLLAQSRLLSQLHRDQLGLLRLQQQISTGYRISAPSEDAPAAGRAQTLQRLLELKAQAQVNRQTGQSYLDASDTAINGVSKLLSDIRAEALGVSDTVSSDSQRAAVADEVLEAIRQLADMGNHNFRGRYLFAGSRSDVAPFEIDGKYIRYVGNEGALSSFVDLDLLYATNAPGSEVFGTFSPGVRSTVDFNPTLTVDTPLSSLRGGRGITLGSIAISDGTNTQTIDLSSAATIGDVADLISANPPTGRTITATVTSTGLSIDIDDGGGGNLTIREVGGGRTAFELGILDTVGTGVGPIVGSDLNPSLRLTTSLSDVLGGTLDQASGIQIVNGGQTHTITFATATTVEDLLNAINGSEADVLAEIDPAGDRIRIRSRLSGSDFSIGENGGTTATQLGVRSLTLQTPLADLNGGLGIHEEPGTDFTIRRRDGVLLDIDVGTATTIGDIINLINTHPANVGPDVALAQLAASGNGIELVDANAAPVGPLEILRDLRSNAAWDLGLIPRGQDLASSAGSTLTGSDPYPLEVAGAFNSLVRLHDALLNNDVVQIGRAIELLDLDFERANFARAEIGSRGRSLETVQARLEDEEVQLRSNLSDEIDTDLADAISQLTARQAALEASLQLAAQTFRLSLLDFL